MLIRESPLSVLVEEAGGGQGHRDSAMSRQINLPPSQLGWDASHGPYRIPEGGSHPTRPSLSFTDGWSTSPNLWAGGWEQAAVCSRFS